MTPRHEPTVILTHAHHIGTMLLLIFVHTPDEQRIKTAHRNVDAAVTAAWTDRPDGLHDVTLDQYREVLYYFAAPQLFDIALLVTCDQAVPLLVSEIRQQFASITALYPPRRTWWVICQLAGDILRIREVQLPPAGDDATDEQLREIEEAGLIVAAVEAATDEDARLQAARQWEDFKSHYALRKNSR